MKVFEDGLTINKMEDYVNSFEGFSAEITDGNCIIEIIDSINENRPVFVRMWDSDKECENYSVVVGYNDIKNTLTINDPSVKSNLTEMSYRQFLDLWEMMDCEFAVKSCPQRQSIHQLEAGFACRNHRRWSDSLN